MNRSRISILGMMGIVFVAGLIMEHRPPTDERRARGIVEAGRRSLDAGMPLASGMLLTDPLGNLS
ncbi:MAG: hypothetical protein ACLQIB_21840 [Isosphaeraceae bacterium]